MTNFKRALSLIFAIALMLSTFAIGAYSAGEADGASVSNATYQLPLNDDTFNAQGYGQFRLAALNTSDMSVNYCDIFTDRTTDQWATRNASYLNTYRVVFQEGENGKFRSQLFSDTDSTAIRWGSVIEFTAPTEGFYEISVGFNREDLSAVVGEYYLVNGNGTTVDLTNPIDSLTLKSNEGKGVNQILSGLVSLGAGEKVWFVHKIPATGSTGINRTIITGFTAEFVGADIESQTFSLPLNTTVFTHNGKGGQFRIAALNMNDLSVNYCRYFTGPDSYGATSAAYWSATHVVFQEESGKFRSQIFGENSGAGTHWGSVVEFTAPTDGYYHVNASFYRQDAAATVGEYYLVKGNGSVIDLSDPIDSITLASGEGKDVLQTLGERNVALAAGEKVWLVNAIASGASYNVNKTIITDFSVEYGGKDVVAPHTYELPLDTSVFREAGKGQFRIAALNMNNMSVNYCRYFTGPDSYGATSAAYWNATHVVFQEEAGKFRSQIFGENSGAGTHWGSVVEFTAPTDGFYNINASFYRQDAAATVGEYYLVKGNGTTVTLTSPIDSLTLASGAGKDVLQTLSGSDVALEAGEKVWLVNTIASDASYNVNKTIITGFTVEYTGKSVVTPKQYSFIPDDSSFQTGGVGPFRLAALNGDTLRRAYCDIFTARETTYNTRNACYYSTSNVLFQQGERVGNAVGTEMFVSQCAKESGGLRWSSVIEFTAPFTGMYDVSAEFVRRYANSANGTYYLVKNGVFSDTTILAELSAGSQDVGQTKSLNSTGVHLKKGDTIWFVNKVDDSVSVSEWRNNATVINEFTVTLVSTAVADVVPQYIGASFNSYGLNLFFDVPENTEGYSALCTFRDGTTVTKDVSSVIFFSVPAKQIFDIINVEIFDAQGNSVTNCQTSVAGEAGKVLGDSSAYADEKAFAQATLNLGKAAKEYFGYYTSDDMTEATAPTGPVGALNAAVTSDGAVSGIEYSRVDVVAADKIYLRYYFTVTDASKTYTVTVGGVPMTLSQAGDTNEYWVGTEVAAGEFGTSRNAVITDGASTLTVSASVYSYIQKAVEENDESLLPFAKALYDYDAAASQPEPSGSSGFELQSWVGHGYDKLLVNQSKPVGALDTYTVYAAKGETEGLSLGLIADSNVNVTVRVMNSPSLHVNAKVYRVMPSMTVGENTYTDAALSITGRDTVSLPAEQTAAFLVEFTTSSSALAGDYVYNIGIYNESGSIVKVIPVTLHVWDFALPEEKTFETTMGYDESPLYLQYDLLLEHNICGQRIPTGSLLGGEADDYMNNPKVTTFRIVVDWDNMTYDEIKTELTPIYKKIIRNPDWLKKAYFYIYDEPTTAAHLAKVKERCEFLETYFPLIRRTSTIWTNTSYNGQEQIDFMANYLDLHCPKLSLWEDGTYTNFSSKVGALQNRGDKVWAYVCNYPEAPYLNVRLDDQGLGTRVMFWQMYQRDIGGFLYWHADFWNINNPWNSLAGNDAGIYGDGILTYPGSDVGRTGTVPSIRLKIMRDGIDDIELMYLAESVLGENWAKTQAATVSLNLTNVNVTSDGFYNLRVAIGNAIEAALLN